MVNGAYNIRRAVTDPGSKFRQHGEHGARTYNGGLGAEPPGGVHGRQGFKGRRSLKLKVFLHLHRLRSWLICNKFCRLFLRNKNFRRTFWSHAPSLVPGSVSDDMGVIEIDQPRLALKCLFTCVFSSDDFNPQVRSDRPTQFSSIHR